MTRNIAYAHYWGLPAQAASSVHVMKMCQAFQQADYPTSLYVPDAPSIRPALDDIWHHFGITTPFQLELIRPIPFFRKHDVAIRAALKIRATSDVIAYGRNLAALMWTSLLGVPTGFELHDAPSPIKLKYLRLLVRGSGFRCLVTISKPLKELYLEQLGISEDKIKVEADAVDIARFENLPSPTEARQQLELNPQQFTIGYAGSLFDGRGINIILELAQIFPDIHFLLVGGNSEQVETLRQEMVSQNILNITFIGFVSNTQLPLYLAASDILLMPYQNTIRTFGNVGNTSRWMSPMKMFEYMATNRPIISSDIPVLREVLNENNSILVTADDVDNWADAIHKLYYQADFAATLANKAREDVLYYTWNKRVQRILQYLVD